MLLLQGMQKNYEKEKHSLSMNLATRSQQLHSLKCRYKILMTHIDDGEDARGSKYEGEESDSNVIHLFKP